MRAGIVYALLFHQRHRHALLAALVNLVEKYAFYITEPSKTSLSSSLFIFPVRKNK